MSNKKQKQNKETWTVKEAGKPDFTFTITTIKGDEECNTES